MLNTMTQAHLERLYVQMHRNPEEGKKFIQKFLKNGTKVRRFTTHPHTSIPCKTKAGQTNKNLPPTVGSTFVPTMRKHPPNAWDCFDETDSDCFRSATYSIYRSSCVRKCEYDRLIIIHNVERDVLLRIFSS